MTITLALNEATWDLTLDNLGNIATKSDQRQKAQDVATSVKVYSGECVFDSERGLPYNLVMAEQVNRPLLQEYVNIETKRIDGVQNTEVVVNGLKDRELDFDILVSTEDGVINGL